MSMFIVKKFISLEKLNLYKANSRLPPLISQLTVRPASLSAETVLPVDKFLVPRKLQRKAVLWYS